MLQRIGETVEVGNEKMGETPKGLPIGAGKSSFALVDSEKIFGEIGLKQGDTLLDLACGAGAYTLAAARIVGNEGLVYAVDLWKEGIAALRKQASEEGIGNIRTIVADVGQEVPIENATVDICLMATVFHDLVQIQVADQAMGEVRRMLKSSGILAVIEFRKIQGPPGPPVDVRLAPQKVEQIVLRHGFRVKAFADVGPYNYLMIFTAS